MQPLPTLPRVWVSIDLPGYREDHDHGTYGFFSHAELPRIPRDLDDRLAWLSNEPPDREWAIASAESGDAWQKWTEIDGFLELVLPASFDAFTASSDAAARIRSATGCYVEAPDFLVTVIDGGQLVHFLSDQQWIRHWLLFVGADGAEAVVSTYPPYGFIDDYEPWEKDEEGWTADDLRTFDPPSADAIVCADSFSEFLYRFWIENEIFFRQAEGDDLTPDQRRYMEHYARR